MRKANHNLAAGDHVIRWELLPIAWPIQIHGIVLTVSETTVVLVDFGLTAAPRDTDSPTHEEASSTGRRPWNWSSSRTPLHPTPPPEASSPQVDPKETPPSTSDGTASMDQRVAESMKTFRWNSTATKQRLNVVVIQEESELEKWKKVSYDDGFFFGLGKGSKKKATDNGDTCTLAKEENADSTDPSASDTKEARPLSVDTQSSWWRKQSTSDTLAHTDQNTTSDQETKSTSSNDNKQRSFWWGSACTKDADKYVFSDDDSISTKDRNEAVASKPSRWWRVASLAEEREVPKQQPTNNTNTGWSWRKNTPGSPQVPVASNPPDVNANANAKEDPPKDDATVDDSTTVTTSESSQPPSATTSRWFSRPSGHIKEGLNAELAHTAATNARNKKVLHDPPELVLARTRWLLEHGETFLPPYHAFHSNSECIAVFCKTGCWTTLQSDIFLHSTALGNAKTMGAATLGVAATAPLLAPVLAGVGLGLVAAPWYILRTSKQQAEEYTRSMNDMFWAQAEPEVFVACIEAWSILPGEAKK
eukprot:Nitzschia sp. Nitz4//scaffold93_size78505//56201//57799//NITZ4_005426-RA/size78505-processed-gene-0.91-mRNA-1//1//CDS//3329560306//5990//frame0